MYIYLLMLYTHTACSFVTSLKFKSTTLIFKQYIYSLVFLPFKSGILRISLARGDIVVTLKNGIYISRPTDERLISSQKLSTFEHFINF